MFISFLRETLIEREVQHLIFGNFNGNFQVIIIFYFKKEIFNTSCQFEIIEVSKKG